MIKLAKGWDKANKDTRIMEQYCKNKICLETAIELMEYNNGCEITIDEFQDLLWKCGYRRMINEFERFI